MSAAAVVGAWLDEAEPWDGTTEVHWVHRCPDCDGFGFWMGVAAPGERRDPRVKCGRCEGYGKLSG